ncbi:flavin reductase family protein [Nocardia sp. NPDC058499]|uniref:flavin reductase family protein n=1 Tax=Nocardia sp. NPDC058499 TaxID=3346530 RepID=UPI0036505F23
MRTDIDPDELGHRDFYKVLTSVVVPRPIAWVSTRSTAGVDNLAPHSFFTVSCVRPPMVQFTSVGRKDSLRNVLETGEFVVCLATESMFEQVNATGTDFPAELSEFTEVGLTPEPSATVAPPRVAESPVALECGLEQTLELGDSTVVIGRVRHVAIDTAVLHTDVRGNNLPAIELLRPLARLGRNEWSTIGEVLEIARIPHEKWPGELRREVEARDAPALSERSADGHRGARPQPE